MLDKRFGEQVEIRPGSTGQFDIVVDGRLIFSKASAGRFPLEGEIEQLFAALKPEVKPAEAETSQAEDSAKRRGVLGRLTNKFLN